MENKNKYIEFELKELQEKAIKRINTQKEIIASTKAIKSTITLEDTKGNEVKISKETNFKTKVSTESLKEIETLKDNVEKFLVKNSVIGLVRKSNKTELESEYKNFSL